MRHISSDPTDLKAEQFLDKFLDDAKGSALRLYEKMLSRCDSPIERLLLSAMMATIGGEVLWLPSDSACMPQWASEPFGGYAQMNIGKYRADFAFIPSFEGAPLVVECDGHDFHERTKEQAKRDRSRDRWMVEHGFTVLRFTGSEIFQDAEACAQQIYSVLVK